MWRKTPAKQRACSRQQESTDSRESGEFFFRKDEARHNKTPNRKTVNNSFVNLLVFVRILRNDSFDFVWSHSRTFQTKPSLLCLSCNLIIMRDSSARQIASGRWNRKKIWLKIPLFVSCLTRHHHQPRTNCARMTKKRLQHQSESFVVVSSSLVKKENSFSVLSSA